MAQSFSFLVTSTILINTIWIGVSNHSHPKWCLPLIYFYFYFIFFLLVLVIINSATLNLCIKLFEQKQTLNLCIKLFEQKQTFIGLHNNRDSVSTSLRVFKTSDYKTNLWHTNLRLKIKVFLPNQLPTQKLHLHYIYKTFSNSYRPN